MPLNITRKNTPARKPTLPTPSSVSSSPPSAFQKPVTSASPAASPPRTRQPFQRSSADSTTSTLARKPSQSSILSTASKSDKKRPTWRGVAKAVPSLLKSSRASASSTSLVAVDQDAEQPALTGSPNKADPSSDFSSKIPRRSSPSPKATLIESTSPSRKSIPIPQGRESEERISSDGSATMVEDIHSNERSLSDELSSTKHQLSEMTNECSALREHIRTLETTQNTQLRQSVAEAVNHTKAELQRAHTAELETQQETVRHLQKRNEELASRIMVVEDKADSSRSHAAEMQLMQSKMKNLQHSFESLQRDLKTKDEQAIRLERQNGELKGQVAHLEEDGRLLAEGGAEAQKRLLADVNYYREQLEDARRNLADRDVQVTQLQSSKAETENLLVCAQSSVDEKDTVIADLRRRASGNEKKNASLESKLIRMESEFVEIKNSAEQTIEALRSELSSSSTTIQQLRVSLDTSRADTQAVTTAAEDHVTQLRQARERAAALEQTVRALEEEKSKLETEKADLVRACATEVEAERRAVHNLRRSMESSQRDSSAKQERSSILSQANEDLRREIIDLKEQHAKEGESAKQTKRELEAATASLAALEDKNRLALAAAKEEKEKLMNELDQQRRQLEDVQNKLSQRNASSPQVAQEPGEEKLKSDLQKAETTIEQQKAVISRLQQSVGDQVKTGQAQPRLLSTSAAKASPSRPTSQRSRSSTIVSRPDPPRASSPPSRGQPARSSTLSSSSTSNVPRPSSSSSPPSHEGRKMLNDHDQAFQAGSTESESDGEHAVKGKPGDLKRIRPPTEMGLVYKLGHSMFGSLWRRIWG